MDYGQDDENSSENGSSWDRRRVSIEDEGYMGVVLGGHFGYSRGKE